MKEIFVFAPVVVLAAGFVGYCLYDLRKSDVRWLPKWAWGIICVISVPLGGIVYLAFGQADHRGSEGAHHV